MSELIRKIRLFWKNDSGLTMVEYAVVGTVIVLVAFTGFTTFGSALHSVITSVANSVAAL